MQKFYPVHSRCFFSAQKRLRTKKHMHKSSYREMVFTHKVLCTEVLRTRFHAQHFLHTDVFTQTQIAHKKTCAHSTRIHIASFGTERLCFPFLITYLSCSPLSSDNLHKTICMWCYFSNGSNMIKLMNHPAMIRLGCVERHATIF